MFAAASLTEAMTALAAQFEAAPGGCKVKLHFLGTPQLVLQIQEGAPADVFASADAAHMQALTDRGLCAAEPVAFAHNRLCLVARKNLQPPLQSLADLDRQGLRVLLCGPQVPAGRYARKALDRAGVQARSLSDEPSVKAVVAKIALGEADAGIVYATDAQAAGDSLAATPIPPELQDPVAYPVAVLRTARAPQLAASFVAFLRSEQALATLRRFGFTEP